MQSRKLHTWKIITCIRWQRRCVYNINGPVSAHNIIKINCCKSFFWEKKNLFSYILYHCRDIAVVAASMKARNNKEISLSSSTLHVPLTFALRSSYRYKMSNTPVGNRWSITHIHTCRTELNLWCLNAYKTDRERKRKERRREMAREMTLKWENIVCLLISILT